MRRPFSSIGREGEKDELDILCKDDRERNVAEEEEDGAKEVVGKKRVGEAMDDEEEVGSEAGNAADWRWGTRVAVVAMRCLVATRLVATYIAQG